MLENNRNKRILSAILLSITLLLAAKEMRTEIINNQSNTDEIGNTLPSIIAEEYVNEDTAKEEQKKFTEDELEKLIEEGIVIKKRYGNSIFYVYCIEVPNGTNNRCVPNGYKMFEELRGFKYGETSQIIYERTGIYHTGKKEYSRIRK